MENKMKLPFATFLLSLALCLCACAKTEKKASLSDSVSNEIYDIGYYETYVDSLRASQLDMRLWGRYLFSNERQYKFVYLIHYADTYETYFGLLNEYLPLPLPRKATEYDSYLRSKVQADSLLNFPGRGSTIEIYLYESYLMSFTYWNIQKFTKCSKSAGLYSAEVDSAWHNYKQAMKTVIDSVAMDRPCCQGTISGLEEIDFIKRLDEDYLESMLDALYASQRHIKHKHISDEMITEAYAKLKSHLVEHVSKPGFEDLDVCYVPLAERMAAIEADEESWIAFINARNRFSQSLGRKQRKAYENATNNLKRNKLWLLKNEYRAYALTGSQFKSVLLPFDCSDKDLLQYDYQTHYEAEFGDFPMFD